MAINAASRGLSLLGQNLIGVNEGFGRLAGGGLNMFQQALSDLVRGTLSRARQALTSFITDAFKQFSRLDKVAREVAIFSGTVDRSFSNFGELAETYRRQITNIAKQTIFSAEEIGRAMTSIASIGQFETPEQLKDVTEVAAALATATGSSFGPAGELLARTMNAFAEELKGAKNAAGELLTEKEKVVAVANILARVANDSALSMAELGDAMQYVSPLAVAAGISLQSSVSMVAALSNMGFNASRAGTAVAQMLEALTAPSAGAAKAMAKLDFSAFDDTGSLKDMGVIIMELKDRLGQLQTEEEQLAITQEVFGTRAGRAMLTLLNNTEQYSQLLRSLAQDSEEGFNLIQVANEEMMKSVAGQVSALEGQLADLRQAFIDALEPLFVNDEKSGILQTINTMLRDPQFVGMIDNIAQAVANLINFLNQNADILFGGLLQAVGSLIPILTFAISAFALLFKETEDGRSIFNMLIGVFTKIFNAIARVLPIVAALIDSFLRAFIPVLDIILDNLDEFMPLLVTLAKAFAQMFYIAAPVMTALAELFVEFAPLINDLVLVFVNLLLPVFSALASVALYVIEVIKENQDEINDLIIGLGRLFHAIVQMLPTLITLGQIFVDVAVAILPLINMILSLIVVVAEHLAVGLHKGQGNLVAFAKLVEFIVNVIADAFSFMSQSILENLGIADEATKAFSNLVEREANMFQIKVIGMLELAAQAAEAAGNTEAAAKYREDIQDILDANAAAQEELDKVIFDFDKQFEGLDDFNMDDFAIDIEFEYDTGEIDRLIAEVENSQLDFEDSIPDEDLIFEPGNVQLTLPDELENQIEENEALFGSISNILAVSEVAGALLGNAALNMNGQGDASGTGDSITDNSVNNSNNTSVDNVNVYITSDGALDSDADTSTADKAMDVIKAVAGGL
jgi:TP901 family phage tail tape measure protein